MRAMKHNVAELLRNALTGLPEFSETFKIIENKFWKQHARIRVSLEEKGLI